MLNSVLLVLAGVLLLYGGAEALVRGSSAIATRLGLSPLVIGLTVVAFGTSMPELVVSVRSALTGNAPIAVGNVVGSNIGNVALILGIAALVRPLTVQTKVVRIDLPLMIAVSVLLAVFLADGSIGRAEGAVLLGGLIVYLIATIRLASGDAIDEAGFSGDASAAGGRTSVSIGLIVVGLALLVFGARWLVEGGVDIAGALGVSDAIIGLTVIAIGTSLPELATSTLAAARGEVDIAVGNVVGSNIFNILGILGIASLTRPLTGAAMTGLDLGMMLLCAAVLLPLARTGSRVSRWEGVALLLGYAAYLALLANGGRIA